MKNSSPLLRMFLAVAAAACLAGCAASAQSRFYTLAPLASTEAKPPAGDARNVLINIAPVEIPDYLDRPQIVTRDGRNELKIAEFDRWAGSLGENISQVLAEDLSLLLGADRVFVNPGTPLEKADYSVVMLVQRLDCVLGDHVLLKAQWTVLSGPEGKNPATQVSTITEKLTDSRYETVAAAVSRTIERVSREIAREITGRQKDGTQNPPAPVGP